MSNSKPTLHHLNSSQSQRILWLLEELQIPYDLKLYERGTTGTKKGRAPDSLKQLNPMGKSPQLVTPEGRVLIESSTIATYLIDTYDKAGKFKGDPSTGNDMLRDETLTSFAGASLNPIMSVELFLAILVMQCPFFVRPVFSAARNATRKMFTTEEFDKSFTWLQSELGDQDYFMGRNPGRADFMLTWPMDMCTAWKFIDLGKYPKLKAWYERCQAREAWKQSLKKGNGYKLAMD